MKTKIFILLIIVSMVYTFGYCESENVTKNLDYKFIYVHGFGERRFPPAFEKKMKIFLEPLNLNSEIITHRWDSQEIDFTKVVYQWSIAKKNADKEAKIFAEQIINKSEKEKTKYILIGYSLGCKVISQALDYCDKLKYLQGVYFLGAALPKDYQVNTNPLPKEMKIINYYSNYLDHALKISFANAEGIEAGGEVGFLDENVFQNYRTVCTHVHKGGPIQRDYSELAPSIAYLSFFKENIFIKGEKTKINFELLVGRGFANWNDIYQFENILIQQNVNTNYYRAISIDNNKRTRKAWGNNLHEILKELKHFTNPLKII